MQEIIVAGVSKYFLFHSETCRLRVGIFSPPSCGRGLYHNENKALMSKTFFSTLT